MSLPINDDFYLARGFDGAVEAEHHSSAQSSPDSETASSKRRGPPKNCRTAFNLFAQSIEAEILEHIGNGAKTKKIEIASKRWRALTDKERYHWDLEAQKDKIRYEKEKKEYKGPWAVPKKRAKKHPDAPKRPMSAFLKFSQTRRRIIKKENPDITNTDVSQLLGEMWRNANPKEKAPYVEEELRERAEYKIKKAKFDADLARKDVASRTRHDSVQRRARLQQYAYDGYYQYDRNSSMANSIPVDHPRTEKHRYYGSHAPEQNTYQTQPYQGGNRAYDYGNYTSQSSFRNHTMSSYDPLPAVPHRYAPAQSEEAESDYLNKVHMAEGSGPAEEKHNFKNRDIHFEDTDANDDLYFRSFGSDPYGASDSGNNAILPDTSVYQPSEGDKFFSSQHQQY